MILFHPKKELHFRWNIDVGNIPYYCLLFETPLRLFLGFSVFLHSFLRQRTDKWRA